MKIFLLALLGLAAGGVVETISTSSSSDSTSSDSSSSAAATDSSDSVVASSDTNSTVSPTSISSTSPTSSPSRIDSTSSTSSSNSSTSSPTAPAGGDIRDIVVSMSFTAQAIDDGSDKEMFSNINKSVADSLQGALGTDVTMSKMDVVETANVVETTPAGRRLSTKTLDVTYVAQVDESNRLAFEEGIKSKDFRDRFAAKLKIDAKNIDIAAVASAGVVTDTTKICLEEPSHPSHGKCLNNGVSTVNKPCVVVCDVDYAKTEESNYTCSGSSPATWIGDETGTCVQECPLARDTYTGKPDHGQLDCTGTVRQAGGSPVPSLTGVSPALCPVKCDPNYHLKTNSNYTCNDVGVWQGAHRGVCELACKTDDANTVDCWTSAGIGKCSGTNAASEKTCVAATCSGAEESECGAGSIKGKCRNTVCVYEKKVSVYFAMNFTFDDKDLDAAKSTSIRAGTDVDFNKHFKDSVSAALPLKFVASKDVDIKHIKDSTARRRLDGKFLHDDPTRMLQVEYSVHVNESDAAVTKAVLDTFMYSSNLN